MSRITITLSHKEKTALLALAEKEFREPRMHAALIIRRELERQGLVETANPITKSEPPTADKAKKIRQRRLKNENTIN